MKWTRAHARSAWTTKDGRQSGAPAITTLRRVVRQQIKAGGNEIDKLKLCNRPHSHQRRATRCPNDRTFRDRRIDNSFLAKLVDQAIWNLERPALRADVLARHKHGWIPFHLFPD